MKLKSVPMECAKCKTETAHSIAFTEHAKAATTLRAECSACTNTITVPVTGMGNFSSISDLVQAISAMGSRRRKISKPGS
jgi:hypothetical protein